MADIVTDTANDILFRAIEILEGTSVVNRTAPGSKLRTLLSVMATELERTQGIAQANALISLAGGATGPFLDFIGELLGVSRSVYTTASISTEERTLIVKPPVGIETFGEANDSQDIVIPSGTIVSTSDNTVSYRLTSGIRLKAASDIGYAEATATTIGAEGNIASGVLTELDFSNYTSYPASKLVVTNSSSIESGEDGEPDELYRFRIQHATRAHKGSNAIAIRMGMLSLPGVDEVHIVDLARGVGTADIVLETSAIEISGRLRTQAVNRLAHIKALGIDLQIQLPIFIGFRIELSVKGGRSNFKRREIAVAIRGGVRKLIARLSMGEGISLNRLESLIVRSHPDIIDIGNPGEPIDRMFIYRDSPYSQARVALVLPPRGNIAIAREERLILEGSLSEAISIDFV